MLLGYKIKSEMVLIDFHIIRNLIAQKEFIFQ